LEKKIDFDGKNERQEERKEEERKTAKKTTLEKKIEFDEKMASVKTEEKTH
jgi:hypothetical protein